jgi:hypothetical protein
MATIRSIDAGDSLTARPAPGVRPCLDELYAVLARVAAGPGLGPDALAGAVRELDTVWLRWCDRQGRVIPTGAERANQERQRADQERQRADQERQRADQERLRAEHLAAQLRGRELAGRPFPARLKYIRPIGLQICWYGRRLSEEENRLFPGLTSARKTACS